MSSEFRLYPEERHWWSFSDYRAVLETMRALQPKRVLEFGPGSSTLALIEGGAERVDTCEDDPEWAEVYEDRLQRKFPDVVRLYRYVWADPLAIPAIDGDRYDLALIDGPRDTMSRLAVVRYALERCAAVLVPAELESEDFLPALRAIAAERGWDLSVRETGPLAGGFALFAPKAAAEETPAPPVADEAPTPEPDAPSAVPPAEITTPESGLARLLTRRKGGRRKKGQA